MSTAKSRGSHQHHKISDATPQEKERYDVFLSSSFTDNGPLIETVRADILHEFAENHVTAWAWETSAESQPFETLYGRQAPSFLTIKTFLRGLEKSEIVILFLSHRRGSNVPPWNDRRLVFGTFLEMEIYFSIVWKKPIILLWETSLVLEDEVLPLIDAARRSGQIGYEARITRDSTAKTALQGYRSIRNRQGRKGLFHLALALRRDPGIDYLTTTPFLYGASIPGRGYVPTFENLDQLLREAANTELPLLDRMSRIWLVLQDLLTVRPMIGKDVALTSHWERALKQWGSCSAWFGLHTHLAVSPLIAQSERMRIAASSASTMPERLMPYGAIASARYSVARRERLGWRRDRELKVAGDEAQKAIDLNRDGDLIGNYAILAHSLLRRGRLLGAKEGFEQCLNLSKAKQDMGRLGEALLDLGFVNFILLRRKTGLQMMEEGIELLGNHSEFGQHLRGLRKLEFVYRVSGRYSDARRLNKLRKDGAKKKNYYDQL